MAQMDRLAESNIGYSTQKPHQQERSYKSHPHQLQQASASILDPLYVVSHTQFHPYLGYGSEPLQPHLANRTELMQLQIDSKRSGPHDELDMDSWLYGSLQGDGMEGMSQQSLGDYEQPREEQRYHGHHLPASARLSKIPRQDEAGESSIVSQGAPSVVGQPGMPTPARKPRGPKLKFTPEDDRLLVDLKENKSLSWKQIAEFFPGRSSGTLQVRYCTKLKAKTTPWTDETVSLFTSSSRREETLTNMRTRHKSSRLH
jgi:hypothetical protein